MNRFALLHPVLSLGKTDGLRGHAAVDSVCVSSCAAIWICICGALAVPTADAQTTNWISQSGTPQTESGAQVAADGAGGVFVATNSGNQVFGPSDVILARYDGLGQPLWTQTIGSAARDEVFAADSDGAGGFFLSGSTSGDLGGPSAGSFDAWVGHFDSAGNQIWLTQLGSTAFDIGSAVASDGAGGAFACGATQGDLGGVTSASNDAWLARFDASGAVTWIRQLDSGVADSATGVVHDGTGGVYACGVSEGDLFGSGVGDPDPWLARFGSGGNALWGIQWASGGAEDSVTVALNGASGIYVSGNTPGALGSFNAGGSDVWISRVSATGNQTWIEQFGTLESDRCVAVASDLSGGLYVVGTTAGSLGSSPSGGFGGLDAWVARYDDEGDRTWVRQFGTAGFDRATGLAVAEPGRLFLGGSTSSDLAAPNAGAEDFWVGSFDSLLSESYCSSLINSSGATAAFTATGSSATLFNRLDLRCASLPPFTFGFFLCSLDQGFVANPGGSQGNLCVSGSIGLYVGPGEVQNSGSNGVISLVADLGSLPQPLGPASAQPGDTWNFQVWFRDANPQMTSNFSNGIAITFH